MPDFTVTKPLCLLAALEEHTTAELRDALESAGIVETIVSFDISDFTPGRPAQTYGDPMDCHPAEPAEWECAPALDYGAWILGTLLLASCDHEPLRKELVKKEAMHDIYYAINDYIEKHMDPTDEVWNHVRED